jgi:hypothetical protein
VNQSQIFKVDLFDPFLNLKERAVEEVRMCTTENSRNFVSRGDVALRGFTFTRGVFGFSADISNQE